MAEFFNGKTVDGVKMYGAVEAQKRNAQSFWLLGSRAGGYMQYKGTGQGMFFDVNTMKPLINAAGFVRALTEWKDIQKFGPANMVNFDTGDVRAAFPGGQAALAIDWGDIGSLSTDKKTSVIQGKLGAVILPGSKEVWDRENNKWLTKSAVNYAPYAAFGGWSGAVNAKSKNKDIAFDYLAFLSQPENSNEDVTLGITGFNPYRLSHFNSSELWIKSGMTKEDASNYLGAIKASLKSKNLVLDIRLPGTDRYQKALDEGIARALAGEESAQAALDGVSAAWDKLTDELGRKKQLTIYRASLKLKSLEGN
jgi:multiple sugar transport system substrate-binding protein